MRVLRDLLRGAGGDDGAAAAAALGAEVDDIVGAFDDVEIVLNDDDRIARINELIQHLDQTVDIGHMQAGGRLVKDIDGLPGIAAGQLIGQLDALRLTTRKRRGCLTQLDVAKTDFLQRLQLARDLRNVGKNTQASSTVMSSTSEMVLSLYLTSSVSRL